MAPESESRCLATEKRWSVIMVTSRATTIAGYLAELPAERRKTISAVRAVVRKHLPKGYKESVGYGMICYSVPLSTYPETYNGQPLCYAALAAQKNYCAIYLMNVYGDTPTAKAFKDGFKKAGKKLDMGKCCVRFKTAADLPLDVIGKTIAATPVKAFIEKYEKAGKR
jgi:uncharacterized protein YdhG (YjbR/CyaY superfamily)